MNAPSRLSLILHSSLLDLTCTKQLYIVWHLWLHKPNVYMWKSVHCHSFFIQFSSSVKKWLPYKYIKLFTLHFIFFGEEVIHKLDSCMQIGSLRSNHGTSKTMYMYIPAHSVLHHHMLCPLLTHRESSIGIHACWYGARQGGQGLWDWQHAGYEMLCTVYSHHRSQTHPLGILPPISCTSFITEGLRVRPSPICTYIQVLQLCTGNDYTSYVSSRSRALVNNAELSSS